jgi:hypothetical protein
MNMAAWRNWMAKHQVALCRQWLATGEAFHKGDPAFEQAKVDLRAAIAERVQEDDTIWHGWYRRHGGEFDLIGDHFGGGDATSVLLVLAALGLLGKMLQIGRMVQMGSRAQPAPRVSAPAAAKPKSSRSRYKR